MKRCLARCRKPVSLRSRPPLLRRGTPHVSISKCRNRRDAFLAVRGSPQGWISSPPRSSAIWAAAFSARLFRGCARSANAYSVYSHLAAMITPRCSLAASTQNGRATRSMAVIEETLASRTRPNGARQGEEISSAPMRAFVPRPRSQTISCIYRPEGLASGLDERNKLIAAVTMEDISARASTGDSKLLVTVAGRPDGM